jgi:hypothetical protein
VGPFDLLSVFGRLLPRLTALVLAVVLVFFPGIAVGVIAYAGREEAARLERIFHRMLQHDAGRRRHPVGHIEQISGPGAIKP